MDAKYIWLLTAGKTKQDMYAFYNFRDAVLVKDALKKDKPLLFCTISKVRIE